MLVRFVVDMTTIGLISDDDKEAYGDTVNTLDQW